MPRPRKLRPTIGGLLALVALIAVGFADLRPARLRVEDVGAGTGPAVESGDAVAVRYVGTLADGTQFDSSRKLGRPFEFDAGRGKVIRGWDVGIVAMRPGGVRRLTVPRIWPTARRASRR